jgi:hypothetical protein
MNLEGALSAKRPIFVSNMESSKFNLKKGKSKRFVMFGNGLKDCLKKDSKIGFEPGLKNHPLIRLLNSQNEVILSLLHIKKSAFELCKTT